MRGELWDDVGRTERGAIHSNVRSCLRGENVPLLFFDLKVICRSPITILKSINIQNGLDERLL